MDKFSEVSQIIGAKYGEEQDEVNLELEAVQNGLVIHLGMSHYFEFYNQIDTLPVLEKFLPEENFNNLKQSLLMYLPFDNKGLDQDKLANITVSLIVDLIKKMINEMNENIRTKILSGNEEKYQKMLILIEKLGNINIRMQKDIAHEMQI